MTSTSRVSRFAVRAATSLAVFAAAVVAGVAMSPGTDRSVQADGTCATDGAGLGAGGEYHAITPTRIFDSRDPALDVAPTGKKSMRPLADSVVFDVPVVGLGGLPAFVDEVGPDGVPGPDGSDDNVLAVAVNITAIAPDQPGYLSAFGTGAPEGSTSLVNFYPGQVVPNTAILRPGQDGEISVRLVSAAPGTIDVAIDVFGWFSKTGWEENGARVRLVGPGRIFDSRLAEFGGAPLDENSQRELTIRGASSFSPQITDLVPDDERVTGVLINITGVNVQPNSAPTFLSAIPAPLASGQVPSTSNLNLLTGQVRSVMAVVPVADDGAIRLFNRAGATHAIVDVVGYLIDGQDPSTRLGRIVPLVSPFRALDTREADFFDQPLAPANAEDWSFESFVNDVKIGECPVGPQVGLIGNLTATDLQREYSWAEVSSFLTAYPSPSDGSTAVPEISNITIKEGETQPNMAVLSFGTTEAGPNRVRFYNRAGFLDYLFDVSAVILDESPAP